MKQAYTEYLKCDFTDSEIAEAAKELARANSRKASIEQQKKDVDAQLKSEIVAQETIIGRLAAQINTGSEYRNVECRVELDTPEAGKKRTIRLDTGEEVSVKPMTDTDRQMVLDLQGKAEAEEAAKNPPKEPIVTPPPLVMRLEAGEVDMTPEQASQMVIDAINGGKPAAGPTLAPARTQGGTHQKGTRGKRARNLDSEAFADGSAVEFDGVPDEYAPEESPE